MRARLFVDHHCIKDFIWVLNFHGWSQLQNYFNSEIFPIYRVGTKAFQNQCQTRTHFRGAFEKNVSNW